MPFGVVLGLGDARRWLMPYRLFRSQVPNERSFFFRRVQLASTSSVISKIVEILFVRQSGGTLGDPPAFTLGLLDYGESIFKQAEQVL